MYLIYQLAILMATIAITLLFVFSIKRVERKRNIQIKKSYSWFIDSNGEFVEVEDED